MLDQQNKGFRALQHHPLLFEMIRSFVTLAKHLNLSRTVEELDSTRQTVRRHIEALESAMGVDLFDVVDRRYVLTVDGEKALDSAQMLLAQGRLWLSGQMADAGGLRLISFEGDENSSFFHAQQQSTRVVWQAESSLMRESLNAWIDAEGQLESPKMAKIRPYVIAYRDTSSGWLCVEVGERSFYSNWFGWAVARSSIGRPLTDFPVGPELARVMEQPYRQIQATHSFRVDQIATRVPREPGGPHCSLCYNRLLLGSTMPDGSFVLVVIVDRPDRISISGLNQKLLEEMPEDARVTYDLH